MPYSRNEFLRLSAAAVGGIALSPLLNEFAADNKIKRFGLQLYTLRDVLLNDVTGILKQVAALGYKDIESYEGPKGMFWGMSNHEFKKILDDLGMRLVSSHCDVYKEFERKVDEAAAIGMKYLLSSSLTEKKNKEFIWKLPDQFNKYGEICRKAGLRFAYHAENWDFEKVDGKTPEEILIENTDPKLVDFQMDIYWFVTGGQDPTVWLRTYKERFVSCHLKDRIKGATQKDASCTLGTGSIDVPTILKAATVDRIKYFFLEQEQYGNSTPMKCVEEDAAYMKKLKL